MSRYSDLEAIVGHKNYYKSKKSGIIYYKDQVIGKFSTKEKTILKAKYAVEIRRQQLLNFVDLTQAKRKIARVTNPKISDVWNDFVNEKKTTKSKGTIITYNTSWKLLKIFFNDKNVSDLNEKNLVSFKNWYISNYSNRLVERTVIHLKSLIRYCYENKTIREMPKFKILDELVEFVDIKSNRKPHERVYNDFEIESLLRNSKECSRLDYINDRTYLAILLAVKCGMRKHEVLGIEWKSVDYSRKWLSITSTKNSTWRKFPLSDELIDAFKKQEVHSKNISEFVFPMPSDYKKPISSQILDKHWTVVKDMSGIKGVAKFHDLRKTCVTNLIELGIPSDQISKLLDHSVKEIHETYYKLTNKFKDDFLEKIKKQTINKGENR